MDAVRELTQLDDRLAELRPGFVDARHELVIRSEPASHETQRERQPDQALLGPVVEVALEPAALGVACLDDAGARRAEVLELGACFGLQALVLEREARRRRDFLDQLGVVEEVGSVEDQRDGRPSRTSGVAARSSSRPRSTGRPRTSAYRPSPIG